jgi:hypothetical protein
MAMHVDGGCLCGAIAYEAVVDPERCAICHCTNCQTNSGTAFGWIVHVKDRQFTLTRGTLKVYETVADSGRRRCLSFCGDCGTRIHAQTPEEPDVFFGLRAGTVNQRHLLRPKRQLWCRSAAPWVFEMSDLPPDDTQS